MRYALVALGGGPYQWVRRELADLTPGVVFRLFEADDAPVNGDRPWRVLTPPQPCEPAGNVGFLAEPVGGEWIESAAPAEVMS